MDIEFSVRNKIMNKKIFLKGGGFTLVEIAIVLVIIGLLLGGILKGQELINNAKVRAIADRQNSLKVAWFSFIDRFAALPGDYVQAAIYISGAANGDGNGTLSSNESPLAFQHLASAGYLRCPQCNVTAATPPSAVNSLINSYGGIMSIWHDGMHYAVRGTQILARLQVHTGPRIPSNIMSEVDRKIDDGIPNTGDTVFNRFDPSTLAGGGTNPIIADGVINCIKVDSAGATNGTLLATVPIYWRPANSNPPVFQDCGAGVFI